MNDRHLAVGPDLLVDIEPVRPHHHDGRHLLALGPGSLQLELVPPLVPIEEGVAGLAVLAAREVQLPEHVRRLAGLGRLRVLALELPERRDQAVGRPRIEQLTKRLGDRAEGGGREQRKQDVDRCREHGCVSLRRAHAGSKHANRALGPGKAGAVVRPLAAAHGRGP